VLIIFLLGPLLVPVYMSVRPLTKNETRKGGLLWNIFVNAEQFFIWLAGIAITAVFAENFTMPHDKDIADIKRAEIKAGSIMGAVLLLLLLGLERIFFAGFRKKIEG
jgi:nitric oxide reductase large subunit